MDFFAADEAVRALYERAVSDGARLTVYLEGDTGMAKGGCALLSFRSHSDPSPTLIVGEVLWRLGSQGYATVSLPFLPWIMKRGLTADALREPDTLRRASREWQQDFASLVDREARGASGRPVRGDFFGCSWPVTNIGVSCRVCCL